MTPLLSRDPKQGDVPAMADHCASIMVATWRAVASTKCWIKAAPCMRCDSTVEVDARTASLAAVPIISRTCSMCGRMLSPTTASPMKSCRKGIAADSRTAKQASVVIFVATNSMCDLALSPSRGSASKAPLRSSGFLMREMGHNTLVHQWQGILSALSFDEALHVRQYGCP